VCSAIQIVVQVARLLGGARKVVRISELKEMEGDVIGVQDLFEYQQTGVDENWAAVGHFRASGVRPTCLARMEASGISLSPEMFERRILETAAVK
jgi:pilus assembly protein CpaF